MSKNTSLPDRLDRGASVYCLLSELHPRPDLVAPPPNHSSTAFVDQ